MEHGDQLLGGLGLLVAELEEDEGVAHTVHTAPGSADPVDVVLHSIHRVDHHVRDLGDVQSSADHVRRDEQPRGSLPEVVQDGETLLLGATAVEGVDLHTFFPKFGAELVSEVLLVHED
eukprot:CAMPEP_0183593798 /NCGR_PEP_ID=MMETSP0371-20130417/170513_1 /TAXON_ID=268820 /ORGANISM="Peridinium aciculiferum, Strain PAER-2" /LENGTH=118 /DNA_ID=CAMNT_0025805443 /DNA_START=249 /DNA_END=602 /DNA_ORIENTATION=+